MYKIRYTNPTSDGSGYASCGRSYIKALIDYGHDVSINQVSFEEARPDLGEFAEYILPNIQRPNNHTINIIHLTPEQYGIHWQEDKINVGFTVWETTRIPNLWVECCNRMDAVIVPCEWNVKVLKDSGVKVPIYCVPHVVDYTNHEDVGNFTLNAIPDNVFKFYSIFQFTERKDPVSLLKAYWHGFSKDDNVALILKTYRSNYSDAEKQIVIDTIKRIKASMPMPEGVTHAPVYLITDMLSVDEITGLHKYGDCFVSLNRAEGFGLPEAEAAVLGNPVITTGFGGVLEYLDNSNSLLVDYTLTPVSGMPNIPWYTGDQLWAQANVYNAAELMREIYENEDLLSKIVCNCKKTVKPMLSYEAIAERYTKVLDDIVSRKVD